MTGSLRRLALLHLVVNGLLLWLVYYWLGVGESRASTLAWSGFVALLIVELSCWAYGAAFVFFRNGPPSSFGGLAEPALRNMIPLAIAAALAGILYWLLARWADYSAQPAFQIASYLTLKFRTPVRPASVLRVFNAVL